MKGPCAGSIGRPTDLGDGMTQYKTDHNLKTFRSGPYQKQFCLKCKSSTGWYTSFKEPFGFASFGFAPKGYVSERGF